MTTPSFPRHSARTHRFSAGAPRLFTLSPDGRRVVFVRSASGTDVVGRLWVLDVESGTEALAADPTALHEGAEELSVQEQARRERMREGNAGIVGYSTDEAVTHAVFALSGGLYGGSLDDGAIHALDVPGPVIDPRLSPDGAHVAYVSGRSLRLVRSDGTDDRAIAEPSHPLETCGLADFAAAEELDRSRGFWWSPASDAVLVERVDETPVNEWWIADPLHPDRRPRPHRYPAAGTPNALVSLDVVRLDGTSVSVTWDATTYEYLVDVSWTSYGDPLLVVSTRDQRRFAVVALKVASGETRPVAEIADDQWVDASPGAFRWTPDGRLLTLRPDRESDTYRMHLGDDWLTPAGMQVRGVVDVDHEGVLVSTAPDPLSSSLVKVAWDGSVTVLADGLAWWAGRSCGGTDLLVGRTLESTATTFEIRSGGRSLEITTHAEVPSVTPAVEVIAAGDLGIVTAVLWPSDHEPGSRRLPVILSPYGGPHHAEVLASGLSFGEDQWLADQGFCVVVADGRGTPGRGPAWDRAVHLDLTDVVLSDQVAALEAVAACWPGDIDTTRVGIRGWSFGGYLSALAVLKRPDVFHAAVAGAPVTDMRLYDTAYSERYLGNPSEDPAPYDAGSLLPLASGLSRPLMIIHGLTDDNVVVAHTLALSGALTVAGRPHQVLPLSGVTHMTPQEEIAENKLLLELDFLKKSLGVA